MKLYLGARYTRKAEAFTLALALNQQGYAVTATWFLEPESPTIQLDEVDRKTLIAYAKRDIEEIDAADILVLMSDGPREAHPRGGKHVEFGYALGKGKPVIVFGPVENIFHHLPDVRVAECFGALIQALHDVAIRVAYPQHEPPADGQPIRFRVGDHYEQGEVRVVDPKTGGAKGMKIERFDLIPVTPLWDLATVYGMGAKKYEERNWERGYKWSLSFAALQRHLLAFWRREDNDGESGLPHLAHAAFHVFALLEYLHTGKGTDDRARANGGPR